MYNSPPSSFDPAFEARDALARELRRLSTFAREMDSAVHVPGTRFRFGWDAALGLIPVVGDVLGMGLALWIPWRSRALGVGGFTQIRMLANIGLETVIGLIPILGDLFDVGFRANRRNVALLRKDLQRRGLL